MEEQRIYKIVQLYSDGFEQPTTKEKIFAYNPYLLSLAGRDISIDQHQRYILEVRELFEKAYLYQSENEKNTMNEIAEYLKLFWINNSFYDNIKSKKVIPEITFDEFKNACIIAKNGTKLTTSKRSIDTYGMKVDIKLREEVQARANKLNLSLYTGFVMPNLEPVLDPELLM